MRIVHEAVENGVGVGGVPNDLIPGRQGELGGGLPDLASLKRGLEILRREVALRLEKADPLVDLPGPLLS